MQEYSLWLYFLFGFLGLIFRAIEKLRWFGGSRDEEFPVKDGTFWLALWFALIILYVIIKQIGYLIHISLTNPDILILYSNQFFGIGILLFLVFVFLIKGFLNPTLNGVIALSCNIVITIVFWILNIIDYSIYTAPIVGLIGGIIIHQILKKAYDSGNKILWKIPKVWKVVNNRWFLLIFISIFTVEMYLQQQAVSITTFWLYL